ncbi:MAG: SpoIIE family protein phosphatase [Prevotella sp.]|nr:SpoIIE family protein phosphatase [Prevotella sp.]
MERLRRVVKNNLGLSVIIAAALLLELAVGVMFYASHHIIQKTMERLVDREMYGIYLSIRNQLAKVEVTIDNMSWVVRSDLAYPDSMFVNTRRLVVNNPAILGSSITFVPDYYPEKGRWFEPYAVRRADGTVESMQLGSANHDYTESEFFTVPIATNRGHWCEPYMDEDGARMMVTTYAVPVHDSDNKTVAVVDADLSLEWLDGVMKANKVYESTQRFLMTEKRHLLGGEDGPVLQMVLRQLSTISDKEGYFTVKDGEGEKLHVFFHPVGGMTDWLLISALKDDEVFGTLRLVRLLLLLVVGAGLLILGFIVYRTSRHLERLRKVNAEKERISSELRVASKIQHEMLPPGQLRLDDVDVFGSLKPAREVGGDLFHYFVRDEKLFMFIGDVCGKGTPAAMLMSGVCSLLYAFSFHEDDPSRILHAVNEAACQNNDVCMFATVFIGVLHMPTGRLDYCNAGHNAPYVLGKELKMLDCDPNLPIGPFDDAEFNLQTTTLSPGSTIFLYTDGLTEAYNSDIQQFGIQRTENVLKECIARQLDSEGISNAVVEAVRRFAGDAEQSDDLTMLVVQYKSNT